MAQYMVDTSALAKYYHLEIGSSRVMALADNSSNILTYYWLDPVQRVAGLIMTQILPFADQHVLQLYGRFERGVYNALKAA